MEVINKETNGKWICIRFKYYSGKKAKIQNTCKNT